MRPHNGTVKVSGQRRKKGCLADSHADTETRLDACQRLFLRSAERFLLVNQWCGAEQSLLICLPGRVGPKILSKKLKKQPSRVDQRHRASQLRKQKREAVRGVGVGKRCGF